MMYQALKLLTELSEQEKNLWDTKIKSLRKQYIPSPESFIQEAINSLDVSKNTVFWKQNPSKFISELREASWQEYLVAELHFHKATLEHLFSDISYANSLLANAIAKHLSSEGSPDFNKIATIVSETAGYLTPYIYHLCLSTTNSRRSRAGKTFESIISYMIREIYQYPMETQATLGHDFYKESKLGKIVDGIIPSKRAFEQNRQNCIFLTLKTSLRERWQEVAEEMVRTKIPSVYLLTLDDKLTHSNLQKMSGQNMTLIVPYEVQQRFEQCGNVKSYEEFFNKTIPIQLQHFD
ncbi:MAG: type II restriction endonuclease [Vampirovibrionales bacterium]